MTISIRRLDTSDEDFERHFAPLLAGEAERDGEVERVVREIIGAVRRDGDAALLDYTRRFDGLAANDVAELRVSAERMRQATERLAAEQREALEFAAERIRGYHERQRQESWRYHDEDGSMLGQKVTPLDRVGVYVPGGKAAYPSSVLMNAIPAKVAGVREVIMVVPAPRGELSDMVLAAASRAQIDAVITIGGAQAVAALAYGTQSVPRVDKIVGPGNAYVAEAKRQVFGAVGIDMIAGPSEVVVLCDGSAPADWVAMDLFAQAEHDEEARAMLLSADGRFLDAVAAAIERLLPQMERRDIIAAALESRGALVRVADMTEGVSLINRIAPEHLELAVADAEALLGDIRHAGAIFMGRYSAEVLGDYCAGPNHVLPTAGTARFFSPLGVQDFQKRSSLIACSAQGARRLGGAAAVLARAEGLTAHAASAELRAGADGEPHP